MEFCISLCLSEFLPQSQVDCLHEIDSRCKRACEWVCGAERWTDIPCTLFSHLAYSVPGTGSRFTMILTRIKHLMKIIKWTTEISNSFTVSYSWDINWDKWKRETCFIWGKKYLQYSRKCQNVFFQAATQKSWCAMQSLGMLMNACINIYILSQKFARSHYVVRGDPITGVSYFRLLLLVGEHMLLPQFRRCLSRCAVEWSKQKQRSVGRCAITTFDHLLTIAPFLCI